MGHDIVYKEQILPIAHDPFQHVTTVLICQNILLRTGISHILSGTRFVLNGGSFDDLSQLPDHADKVPLLVIICESRPVDEHAQTVESIKAHCPSARVVLLADDMEHRAVLQLCRAGLDGLCSTGMDREALVKVLELVILGETFIPASVGLAVLDQMQNGGPGKFGIPVISSPANDPALMMAKLSDREAQILRCLTQGASNKLIARELGVAEATVKVHIKAILRKVKATNRTQAAMWAAGLLNASPGDGIIAPGE